MLRLNFCVRDGNRWVPQAIVTGNIGGCLGWAALRFARAGVPRQLGFALLILPHPQNRTGCNLTKITFPRISAIFFFTDHLALSVFSDFSDQALDRLVSSSSIRCRTFTDDLSTSSSLRGLTSLCCGNSILQGGFTLRCLQRLSRPHFASQLCHWHDNCCTRGASIPVLSY